MIHDYHPPLEPVWVELAHHLSETDLTALHDIVAEIQQRIERFGKGVDDRQ